MTFSGAPGLRPTADRMRETLFNWLRNDVEGSRCLDLFAGSGSLGIEALSRGASHVTFVECARAVAGSLQKNLSLFGVDSRARVVTGDARSQWHRLADGDGPFDIVFLDPPFATDLMRFAVDALARHACVADGGLVYQEQDVGSPWRALPPGWAPLKTARAGQAASRLIRVSAKTAEPE